MRHQLIEESIEPNIFHWTYFFNNPLSRRLFSEYLQIEQGYQVDLDQQSENVDYSQITQPIFEAEEEKVDVKMEAKDDDTVSEHSPVEQIESLVGKKRRASEIVEPVASTVLFQDVPKPKPRRGRKAMGKEWQRENLVNRIAELQAQYDRREEDKLNPQQKVRLRNHIQAQKSRLRKLDSESKQNDELTQQDKVSKIFLNILEEELDASLKENIQSTIRNRKRTSSLNKENDRPNSNKIQKTGEDSAADFRKYLESLIIIEQSK